MRVKEEKFQIVAHVKCPHMVGESKIGLLILNQEKSWNKAF